MAAVLKQEIAPYGMALTDYAKAIIRRYRQANPVIINVATNFAGTALETTQYKVPPILEDCLLLGAIARMTNDAANSDIAQQIFVQVVNTETQEHLTYCQSQLYIPVTSFVGVPTAVSPITPLPEAYFLPKYSRLEHNWRNAFAGFGQATSGMMSWLGVKLQQPLEGDTPAFVTVKGERIRVGSRRPWWFGMGLGLETVNSGVPSFALITGNTYNQYIDPFDEDIEIHGITTNFFTTVAGVTQTPNSVAVSITDMGNSRFWTPRRMPLPALSGAIAQLYNWQPFAQPYLLKKRHRVRVTTLSTTGSNVAQAWLTLVGVIKV